ncbi:energy transducer TonB family protein [Bradyrhizobium sp. 930_D9_N1_4]|uniref:energy transducer TonB family protein n=1 Tax=Bradyrhizobium sp. 930_D9_N1_4 TaxID=3240374 RepID=UPI003F8B68D0
MSLTVLLAAAVTTSARAEEGTYTQRLVQQIAKFRQYPASAAALTISGTALVHFRLSRDEKLLASEIKQTSGDEDLDKAALETMERGQPFPVAPPEIPEERLDFVVPIVFKDATRLVTPVTGDLHVGAFMTGMCASTADGMERSCKFAAYYLSRAGIFLFPFAAGRIGFIDRALVLGVDSPDHGYVVPALRRSGHPVRPGRPR